MKGLILCLGDTPKCAQPYDNFSVYNAWVYIPGGSPKTNKDRVYTPMGGSPTINHMVYAYFRVSPRHNIKPFTFLLYWILKSITKDIKY